MNYPRTLHHSREMQREAFVGAADPCTLQTLDACGAICSAGVQLWRAACTALQRWDLGELQLLLEPGPREAISVAGVGCVPRSPRRAHMNQETKPLFSAMFFPVSLTKFGIPPTVKGTDLKWSISGFA